MIWYFEEIQSFFKRCFRKIGLPFPPFFHEIFHQVIYVSRGINNAELTLFSGVSLLAYCKPSTMGRKQLKREIFLPRIEKESH